MTARRPPAAFLGALAALLLASCGRGGDPVAVLADRLTESALPNEEVIQLLDDAFGGPFEPVRRPGTSSNVRTFRRPPASSVSGSLPSVTATLGAFGREGYQGAWLTVRPPSGDLPEDLAALVAELFPLPEETDSPDLPEPQAFLQRLSRDGGLRAGGVRWELPEGPQPGRAFFLSTLPDAAEVGRTGFALLSIRARTSAAEESLAAFHRALPPSGGGEVTLPEPDAPRGDAAATRSSAPLVTGQVTVDEAVATASRKVHPQVSGLSARLLDVLWGPGPVNATVVLELEPGVRAAAVLPRDGLEARALSGLPHLGLDPEPGARMPGNLVWSGELGPPRVDLYAGRVHALESFAFEWRPSS